MKDFRPNKDCAWFIRLAQALTWLRCLVIGGLKVKVVGDGMERFQKLKGQRTVITPNHSYRNDPEVTFMLGMMAKEMFNWIAAREVFDWQFGWNGLKLQLIGTYSIVRGALDIKSIEWTIDLIKKGGKKLVMFPEGEISGQTDTLQHLENGSVALAFKALEKLAKANPGAPLPPVNVLPVAIKYKFKNSVFASLLDWLEHLERDLGIKPAKTAPVEERLNAIGARLIEINEFEYNCSVPKEEAQALEEAHKGKPEAELARAKLTQRMDNLRRAILKGMAAARSLDLPEEKSPLDWTRVIRNHLDDFVDGAACASPYQARLHEQMVASIQRFYKDLDRVTSFMCIYSGYFSEHPTEERLEEDIRRLSVEILGDSPRFGERTALVAIGTPINLTDWFQDYKKDRKGTVQRLTDSADRQTTTYRPGEQVSTESVAVQIATMLKDLDEQPPVRLIVR